jgi:hypothetical protein
MEATKRSLWKERDGYKIFSTSIDSPVVLNKFYVKHLPKTRKRVMRSQKTDAVEIDSLIQMFYAQFDNRAGRVVEAAKIVAMLLPDAQIIRNDAAGSETYDIRSFIEPREALLNNGKLVDFHEFEVKAKTVVFGTIAQRCSIFEKTWIEHGPQYSGRGYKTFQFVKLNGRWLIAGFLWQDETEHLQLPDDLF